MKKKVSPEAAARRILQAFPFPKVGAAISYQHIEEYFRRRSVPMPEMAMGLHRAIQLEWVEIGALQTIVMLDAGMDELVKPPQIPDQIHTEAPSFAVEGG